MSVFRENTTRPYFAKGSGAFTGNKLGVNGPAPQPPISRNLDWAIKTLLELNNLTTEPQFVQAFLNYDKNREWVKAIVHGAGHCNSDSISDYEQAVEILKQNGISVNLYGY